MNGHDESYSPLRLMAQGCAHCRRHGPRARDCDADGGPVRAALGGGGAGVGREGESHAGAAVHRGAGRVSEASAIWASFIPRATPEVSRHQEEGPGKRPGPSTANMKKLKLRRRASQMPSELVAQPSANNIDAELGIDGATTAEVISFRAESIMQIFGAQQEIWQKFIFHAATGRPTDVGFRGGFARGRRRAA